ncbi:ATP-binding cassette sub-family C member 9-like [Branchiostoma floridae]|uniref:ATP-binding cassette sub-family C member 9-like n=1 Tax=Branchiostoma floridae TaxID=7739 RepID=A0A9J7N989_BRAFL|nr:ATP-binding cassette sub-family C member 9-like [Branchiostoma floridae]
MADSLFCGPAYPSVNGNTTAVDVRTEECLVDGLNLIPHAGYLPLAFLALLLWRWKYGKETGSETQKGWVLFPGHYARWIVALVLLFTTLCEVGEGVVSDSYTPGHHIHLYLPWIVALLATLLACVYYYQVETSNKPRLLLPLCVYYAMSAGFKAARLAHLYNRDVSSTRLRLSLTWTSVVLYAMHIVIEGYTLFKVKYLSASPVQLKPHSDLKDDNMYYVFPYVTLPSRLTFWWASFILRVGYKEPLEMSHLGNIPKQMRAKASYDVFKTTYDHDKEKAIAKNEKLSLWMVYIKAFGDAFVIAGILRLLVDVLTFSTPLILKGIITWATDGIKQGEVERPMYQGPYLVTAGEFFGNGFILLILMLIVNILRYQLDYFGAYLTFQQGVQLKAAIQTMIYNKVLKLSSRLLSSDKVTAGQVMNHAGMDAQQLLVMMSLIHNPWSMVFQLLAGCILLYFQLGWSAVIGTLLIIIMSPVNYKIARITERLTKKKMATSDTRMKRINETIQAIKLLKLYAWEQMFSDKVLAARNTEVGEMYKRAGWEILTFRTRSSIVFPLKINAAVCDKRLEPFFESDEVEELGNMCRHDVHSDDDNESAKEKADGDVVSEQKVKLLRNPYDKLPEDENSVELKQLAGELSQTTDMAEDVAIEIRNGNFSWELATGTVALHDINLKVLKEKLTVVVGQVGSGKSSLCSAILGEMRTLSGQVLWHKSQNSVAYGAQKPWLLNATLRDNITFGQPFDNARYQKVISACCLQPDIDILPGGDMTEIGEKGINLSGGQKQRVSLARALYSNSDIVILDDPLSALDAHVGGDVFEHGIMAHLINDEKRTVVLVTHKLQYLEESHYVGEEPEQDEEEEEEEEVDEGKAAEGKLVKAEERYFDTLSNAGLILALATYLNISIKQLSKHGLQIGIDFWLSTWASAGTMAGSPLEPQNSTINQTMGNATKQHSLCFTFENCILNTFSRFFDTTPTGRVLNRMSEDTAVIDLRLPLIMEHLIRVVLLICSALLVNAVVTPYFLIGAVPIVVFYYMVQKYYRATAREIKRLDNINKSPVFAHFSETLGGLTTVRAYRMEKKFSTSLMDKLDRSNTPVYYTNAISSWIGARLGYLGAIIVFLAGLSSVLAAMFGSVSPAMIGLSITYALNIQMYLLWLVRGCAMIEMMMTSVERVDSYSSIPTEPYNTDGEKWTWDRNLCHISQQNTLCNVIVDDNWPSKGEVSFEGVSVRYDKTLDPVLTDVSATFEAGEKVGICGRTGSGKSSLTLALFRMIDNFKGKITIDGLDISRVPLTTLRSRLSIIPQDPVLFSGSVRYNLDPFDKCSDEELWEALDTAQLKTLVSELPNKLDEAVSDGGENFSVGQRQLFCLARTFVRKCRILIMDEATASIDMETDFNLQNVIQTAFKDRTVITIAHRIATILSSDRILVLDQGKVVENDSPDKLLKQPNGLFASLVKANK